MTRSQKLVPCRRRHLNTAFYTFWELLKEPSAPKGVFKAAVDAQVISLEEEAELRLLIENRNLTSHAYNVDLAELIAKIIPKHYQVMQKIVTRLLTQ